MSFTFSFIVQFSRHIPAPTVCFSFSTFFSVSRHIPGLIVWVSLFFCFPVLSQSSRSYSLHFFNIFQCFSTYSMSYSVFLIFHVFQFSHHTAGPTVCISHFPCFSVFLAIFQILPWFSHFPRLSVFLTYSRSYIACFSFSTFFRFLAILQVLLWAFLIF